jgi:hypothetical protein
LPLVTKNFPQLQGQAQVYGHYWILSSYFKFGTGETVSKEKQFGLIKVQKSLSCILLLEQNSAR